MAQGALCGDGLQRAPLAPSRLHGFTSLLHINEKGSRFGGTEEYIALLAAGLAAHGVRSHLACGVLGNEAPAGLDSVHVIDGLASRHRAGDAVGRVLELVESITPDVIFLHNVFDPTVVSALAELQPRGPLLWYVHDHYLTCLSELRWRRDVGSCCDRLALGCLDSIGAGRCVLRHPDQTYGEAELAERAALAGALTAVDAVIVVSAYMGSLLRQAAPAVDERLHHLVRPIRPFGPTRRRPTRPVDRAIVVAYAGRITPEKGLARVIEAITATRTRRPVELRIAGVVENAEYWAHCQAVSATATATRPGLSISALGHLDYPAVDREFCDADIAVVPSQWPEPLGAVAAEAMAAGAAVIASDVGGLHELITDQHDGILVPPHDTQRWTAALDRLIEDDRLRTLLARRARATAAIHTVERHIDALTEVISATPRR